MHVGFISIESPFDGSNVCGIASYLKAVIPILVDKGHRVTLIARGSKEGISYAYDTAVKIIHVSLPSLHWYASKVPLLSQLITLPLRHLEYGKKFYDVANKIFKEDPVDVVESSELGALFFAWRCKIPLIIRLHGNDFVFRKHTKKFITPSSLLSHYFDKTILRRAAVVSSPSKYYASEIKLRMGKSFKNILIAPNPLALEIVEESSRENIHVARRSLSRPIVLYVGRLAAVKGVETLFKSLDEVKKYFPNICFIFVGPWQMHETQDRLGIKKIDNLDNIDNINESIVWLGYLSGEKLWKLYRRANIFVMPSYFESFGISVLEAMAFSLPVIASNAGALPELVNDNVTGVLFEPGNARELSVAIKDLLGDYKKCQKMGEAGRDKVLKSFIPAENVNKIIDIYKSVNLRRE